MNCDLIKVSKYDGRVQTDSDYFIFGVDLTQLSLKLITQFHDVHAVAKTPETFDLVIHMKGYHDYG